MEYNNLINSAPVVLVEFYADWCPHCQNMTPVVDNLKAQLGNRAAVCQLDIDLNRDAADEAGVDSLPTFILYRSGSEQWRHTGEITGEKLLARVEASLKE